jgi:DNA-binding NarL/FixJ family response regulator
VHVDVISLKDGSLQEVKSIHHHNPDAIIVVLVNHKSDELLFAAVRAGAVGYF